MHLRHCCETQALLHSDMHVLVDILCISQDFQLAQDAWAL